MSGKYDDLERLRDLFHQGVITETEFNAEKEKILNGSPGFDPNAPTEEVNVDDNRSYNSLMHISQFSNGRPQCAQTLCRTVFCGTGPSGPNPCGR